MFTSIVKNSTLRLFQIKALVYPTSLVVHPMCFLSRETPVDKTEGEKKIIHVLKKHFPQATYIDVSDISGGCGSMYDVFVESVELKGKRTVQQHRLITDALKEEIKEMHGLRIHTSIPEDKKDQ